MNLFHRTSGTNGPQVIILHGLFGSSDNWSTIGKAIADQGYRVTLADLRNHGQSPHDDLFDLDLMANDVLELVQAEAMALPILIGHSLGGKVAMRFACKYPDRLSAMMVLDIAPRAYAIRHHDLANALLQVSQHPMTSRKSVEASLAPLIPDFGVRQWLMKSLHWKEQDRLDWRFNLSVIARNLDQVVAESQCTLASDIPCLFLRGAESDYIQASDIRQIQEKYTKAIIETIEHAGHWLHADNPTGTLKAMIAFLSEHR